MKALLKEISEKAIQLGDINYSKEQLNNNWIGYKPATKQNIADKENKLGIYLPKDYKEFLLISNGFAAPDDVDPSFEDIENIDFLKNINSYLIDLWQKSETEEIGNLLEKSILVGGKNSEQYFLLIPPASNQKNWKYWIFSSWQPGENEFEDLKSYFEYVLNFINECLEERD